MNIGCFLPLRNLEDLYNDAKSLDTNTFQIFLRSPQAMNSKKRTFNKSDLDFFNDKIGKDFSPILGHGPFVANGASAKDFVREKSIEIIRQDLETLDCIDESLYVLHPGSHVGDGVDVGIERLCKVLNDALYKDQKTLFLLETMAGKGSELGRNFDELAKIISNLELKEKVGVCLDTCHIWDAGYDLENDLDGVLEEFDEKIGLSRLKAIHLNNSSNECGSHKDRHANIDNGKMSTTCFENFINHEKLQGIPIFLETPMQVIADYKKDLEILRKLKK